MILAKSWGNVLITGHETIGNGLMMCYKTWVETRMSVDVKGTEKTG